MLINYTYQCRDAVEMIELNSPSKLHRAAVAKDDTPNDIVSIQLPVLTRRLLVDSSRFGFIEVCAHIDFAASCECYPVPDYGMIEASFSKNINHGGLAKRGFLPYFPFHFILDQWNKCITKSCAIESTGNQTKKWKCFTLSVVWCDIGNSKHPINNIAIESFTCICSEVVYMICHKVAKINIALPATHTLFSSMSYRGCIKYDTFEMFQRLVTVSLYWSVNSSMAQLS